MIGLVAMVYCCASGFGCCVGLFVLLVVFDLLWLVVLMGLFCDCVLLARCGLSG